MINKILLILCLGISFQVFSQTPTPQATPTSGPFVISDKNDGSTKPSTISGGIVNGKAIDLVKPPYPPAASAVRASGMVNVQVVIDENGNVISANAISGHALLRGAAESAARSSKFSPTTLAGQKVKVTGIIVYNFAINNKDVVTAAVPNPAALLTKTVWFHRGRSLTYLAQGDNSSASFLSSTLINSLPDEFVAEKELLKEIATKSALERKKIVDDINLLLKSKLNNSELWQMRLGKEIVGLDTVVRNAIFVEGYTINLEELKNITWRINELAKTASENSPIDLNDQFNKISLISEEKDLTSSSNLIKLAQITHQILLKTGVSSM